LNIDHFYADILRLNGCDSIAARRWFIDKAPALKSIFPGLRLSRCIRVLIAHCQLHVPYVKGTPQTRRTSFSDADFVENWVAIDQCRYESPENFCGTWVGQTYTLCIVDSSDDVFLVADVRVLIVSVDANFY